MVIEFEWKSGLVFGLEADKIHIVSDDDVAPDFDEEPNQVIYLHLGIISVCFIW